MHENGFLIASKKAFTTTGNLNFEFQFCTLPLAIAGRGCAKMVHFYTFLPSSINQ